MGGNTASGAALTYTLKNIFSKNGARDTAKQVAIIITDGESLQDKVTEPAKKMRKAGVEIFAIGVGSSYNREELEDMATNPDDEHVFHVDNFDNILAIEREILRDVCQVTGKLKLKFFSIRLQVLKSSVFFTISGRLLKPTISYSPLYIFFPVVRRRRHVLSRLPLPAYLLSVSRQ